MNARAFERAGAAVVLPQAEASATRLGDLVDEIAAAIPARRAAHGRGDGRRSRRADATRDDRRRAGRDRAPPIAALADAGARTR